MITKINSDIIPFDNLIRALCCTPYHGHSHGCPNYNENHNCPPNNLIDKIFDFSKEMYVIYTTFNVGEFAERMRKAHPEWKEMNFPDHPKRSSEYKNDIIARLKDKHPEWPERYYPEMNGHEWCSSRNWYNPRLWQESARKDHREELARFMNTYSGIIINSYPEAHGINITGMMNNIGLELNWQWPPVHNIRNKVHIISIAGHLKG